jgi:deoxycytidylate deaminase
LEIDKFYLREAYRYASQYSHDPIAQNGALLVKDNSVASLANVVAWGTNRLPEGFDRVLDADILNNRERKLLFIRHAERDALYDAVRTGLNTGKLIMYCPWISCDNCADAITGLGLKELIGHTGPDRFYEEIYREDIRAGKKKSGWSESTKAGLEKLRRKGIPYSFVDGKIGGVKIIFVRREYEP